MADQPTDANLGPATLRGAFAREEMNHERHHTAPASAGAAWIEFAACGGARPGGDGLHERADISRGRIRQALPQGIDAGR